MTARRMMFGALDALIDFGFIAATSLSDTARSVLATIEGSPGERRADQTLWGHAAILMRPKAPTTSPSGRCEVVFVRHGDELVPVASRDLRWSIDLDEGDVVVRNLDGTTPVRLHLKADGTAVLEADTVKIGDSGATEAIALGTTLKGYLDDLKSHVDAHVHGYVDDGAPTVTSVPVTAPYVPASPVPDLAPDVPDIESKHKVEA